MCLKKLNVIDDHIRTSLQSIFEHLATFNFTLFQLQWFSSSPQRQYCLWSPTQSLKLYLEIHVVRALPITVSMAWPVYFSSTTSTLIAMLGKVWNRQKIKTDLCGSFTITKSWHTSYRYCHVFLKDKCANNCFRTDFSSWNTWRFVIRQSSNLT